LRAIRITLGYVLLAVALVAAIVWAVTIRSGSDEAPAVHRVSTPEKQVTLVLYAMSDSPAHVTYTCMKDGVVDTCVASVLNGAWNTKVAVPAGTTVYVDVTGDGAIPPSCSITDTSNRLIPSGESSGTGACQAVAPWWE